MVVNSLNFLLFFAIVFVVYNLPICRNNERIRNGWLFLASYFFYGVADWRMIPLLLGATTVFYVLGLWLKSHMNKKQKKKASHITTIGVVLGVGILLYFKYLNFFAGSFADLLSAIGFNVSWTTLNIVLPIGVSFFTFKLISYVIEIHREHIEPSRDFIEFGTYIAFFPTILSGPIDRPHSLIPQLKGIRVFDYGLAVDGFRQILWGMFTKMCIADNLASVTDTVWSSYSEQSGSTLAITALLYFIQLYADFDGYSNMAIGVGKLLGIRITRNFNHPLLARNIADYWRRWHMSLTSWITDYIFMPLNIAFRDLGNPGICMACIINLVVIGLWHGADWTFGMFGLYHGLLLVPLVYSGAFGKNKKLKPNTHGFPKLVDLLRMAGTFILVSIGLVFFRANSIYDAFAYMGGVLSVSTLSLPSFTGGYATLLFILMLLLLEWYQRDKEHPLQFTNQYVCSHVWIRYSIYWVLIVLILRYQSNTNTFIYFQF